MSQSKLFLDSLSAARKIGESRDCAVRAVSIAARVPYDVAHSLLSQKGRRPGRGTHDWQYLGVLKDLGFSVIDETKKYRNKGGKTVTSLSKLLPSRGVFIIRVRGHVACYRAGEIHDWMDPSRRNHIRDVWRISKTG